MSNQVSNDNIDDLEALANEIANLPDEVESEIIKDEKPTEAESGEKKEFIFDARVTGEDGQLHGTIYKSDSQEGLLAEIKKGVQEKDSFINTQKTQISEKERIEGELNAERERNRQLVSQLVAQGYSRKDAQEIVSGQEAVEDDPMKDPVIKRHVEVLISRGWDEDAAKDQAIATREARKLERELDKESEAKIAREETASEVVISAAKDRPDIFLDPYETIKIIAARDESHKDYPRALNTKRLYNLALHSENPQGDLIKTLLGPQKAQTDTSEFEAKIRKEERESVIKQLREHKVRLSPQGSDLLSEFGVTTEASVDNLTPQQLKEREDTRLAKVTEEVFAEINKT